MYSITHKIIRLSQVICANGSRELFRFRVRQFSGLKYYFTWEITPFRNLFSVCPGFHYIEGPFQAGFTVFGKHSEIRAQFPNCCHRILIYVYSVETTSIPLLITQPLGVLPTIIFLNTRSTYIQYGTSFKYILRLQVLSDSYIYVIRCYISEVFTTFLTATSNVVYGTVNQSHTLREAERNYKTSHLSVLKSVNIIVRGI